MNTANRLRAYFDACNAHDGADISAHFTPDARIFDLNHAPVIGAAAIGKFWQRVIERLPGAHWSIDSLVADDARAAAEWTLTARIDQRSVSLHGADHFQFKDGLIQEIHQYWIHDPEHHRSALIDYDYAGRDNAGGAR